MADAFQVGVLEMTPDIEEVGRVRVMVDLAGRGKVFAFYFKCTGHILQSSKLRGDIVHFILLISRETNSKIRK